MGLSYPSPALSRVEDERRERSFAILLIRRLLINNARFISARKKTRAGFSEINAPRGDKRTNGGSILARKHTL